MIILIIFIFISFILSFLFLLIGKILNITIIKNREKISSFECGFDSGEFFRNPFSVRFFLICVQFLIFDIEIALVVPFIFRFKLMLHLFEVILSSFLFLFLVTLGFFHE